MKKVFGLFLVVIISFGLVASHAAPSLAAEAEKGMEVLAEVNGNKIYTKEFDALFQGRSDPKALLDQIIAYMLLGEEAKKHKLENASQVEEQLKGIKDQQLSQFLYKKEVEAKATLSDADIEKMLSASDKYKINFQQIVVRSMLEAQEVLNVLNQGMDFNKLATSRSIAKNATKGGQIGYVIPNTGYFEGELSEEDVKKIFKLKDNELSEPIKTRQGYSIFKAVSRKELSEQELESRKNYLKYKFQKTKIDEAKDALLDRLRSKAKIEIIDKNIKKLEKAEKISEKYLDLTLATVNGKEIKLKDVLPAQRGEYGSQLNSPYLKQPGFLLNILNEKMNDILFVEEAKRLKYDQTEDFKHIYGLFRDGLMGQAYAVEYVKDLKVSDDELKAYYNENKERFKDMPERIRVKHILVTEENEANNILSKLKAGEDFEKMAKEYSICPSSQNGGDLGYFSRGRMAPLFEEAAFKLKVGETSDVVKTNFGFHIIKLIDHKQAGSSNFSDVKYDIEQTVLFQKKDKKIRTLIEDLKSKANIKIKEDLLKKYEESAQTANTGMHPGMGGMQGGSAGQ